VTNCCVQGGCPGATNIDSDPCFVDPETDDFHLYEDSLCVDEGDVPYSGQTDIGGEARVIDIAGRGDGINDVDIGADEFNDE
jgi:hypothetical protein